MTSVVWKFVGFVLRWLLVGIVAGLFAANGFGQSYDFRGLPTYQFLGYQKLLSGGRLSVSGDGGFSYDSPWQKEPFKTTITDGPLNSVFFVSSESGWVVGDKGRIFATNDRGRSWRRQASGTVENLNSLTCVGTVNCWAVGDKGAILSTDDGHTWKKCPSPTTEILSSVDFVDLDNGWAVGWETTILRTRDGGKTWQYQNGDPRSLRPSPVTVPYDELNTIEAVKFFDLRHGWIVLSGGIARTEDGGQSWETVPVDFADALATADGRTIYAVSGMQGRNMRSIDGGKTWQEWKCTENCYVERKVKE